MATKVKGKISKAALAKANTKVKVDDKLLQGNKNFSMEQIAKVENTSKRLITLKAVINAVPKILKGEEITFNVKTILGARGKASDYIADSLPRKLKGYIEEMLGISLVLTIVKIDGKKVKEFTIRKAVKLIKQ